MHRHRLDSVLHGMAEADLSQMVVADPAALFYLTGTWMRPGERMLALLLTRTRPPTLFVNALFVIPNDLGADTVWFTDTDDGAAILARYVDPTRPLGIDKNWPARFLLRLMELSAASRFVNASALVDGARMHKDEQERAAMRVASALNDQAMGRLLTRLPDRPSEQQLARALAGIYDDLGADGVAFDPIIAYGPNAAEGHHVPGDRRLSEGDAVILDIGCTKDRYCSDMTRTVFYRRASCTRSSSRRRRKPLHGSAQACASATSMPRPAGTSRPRAMGAASLIARDTRLASRCTTRAMCLRRTTTGSSPAWCSRSSRVSRFRGRSASGSRIWSW
jgi:Xaa-Pro dipeptidase